MAKTKNKAEFGDFQTPKLLAKQVCEVVHARMPIPAAIVEPTCGIGVLLLAAADAFPDAQQVIGGDIAPVHIAALEQVVATRHDHTRFLIQQLDYFTHDWSGNTANLPTPLLVIGNPPWVTNSELSVLGSDNKPHRYNFQEFKGVAAVTGKSNFDISEWMLLDMLRWLNGRDATLAMLVKTSVARKALMYAWKNNLSAHEAAIYQIDAKKHFEATVDACLFICRTSTNPEAINECYVYNALDSTEPTSTLSYQQGKLIANVPHYKKWQHLQTQGINHHRWRSGIKHDCAKVMELIVLQDSPAGTYQNGFKELVQLEDTYVFPMLKTSEVANGTVQRPRRRMIVPQRTTGEDTDIIAILAPATWAYLQQHSKLLDGRQSSIHKKRKKLPNPKFSVFGIGAYAFTDWKVAISGLYKRLSFTVVGPHEGQPVVLDDASYFLSCHSEGEALFLAKLLNSNIANEFFEAFIFWDTKRPITVDLLQRLDLEKLATELGLLKEYVSLVPTVQEQELSPI